MQQALVLITTALVLAACAEGLPEGEIFMLQCILDVEFTFDVKFLHYCLHCLQYTIIIVCPHV